MGGMGGNGGKWEETGGNGKWLQVHHGICVTMFQQERKMEENGVEIGEMGGNGGKWGEMGGNGGEWEIVTSTSWKMCDNVSTRKENGGKRRKWGGWGKMGGNVGKWGEMGNWYKYIMENV